MLSINTSFSSYCFDGRTPMVTRCTKFHFSFLNFWTFKKSITKTFLATSNVTKVGARKGFLILWYFSFRRLNRVDSVPNKSSTKACFRLLPISSIRQMKLKMRINCEVNSTRNPTGQRGMRWNVVILLMMEIIKALEITLAPRFISSSIYTLNLGSSEGLIVWEFLILSTMKTLWSFVKTIRSPSTTMTFGTWEISGMAWLQISAPVWREKPRIRRSTAPREQLKT